MGLGPHYAVLSRVKFFHLVLIRASVNRRAWGGMVILLSCHTRGSRVQCQRLLMLLDDAGLGFTDSQHSALVLQTSGTTRDLLVVLSHTPRTSLKSRGGRPSLDESVSANRASVERPLTDRPTRRHRYLSSVRQGEAPMQECSSTPWDQPV